MKMDRLFGLLAVAVGGALHDDIHEEEVKLLQTNVHRSDGVKDPYMMPFWGSEPFDDYFTPGGIPGWSIRRQAQVLGRMADNNNNNAFGISCTCNDLSQDKFYPMFRPATGEISGIDSDVKCAKAALSVNSRVFTIRRLNGPNGTIAGIACRIWHCRAGDGYATKGIKCPIGCAPGHGYNYKATMPDQVVDQYRTTYCPEMSSYFYGENAIGEVDYGAKGPKDYGGYSKVPESGIANCRNHLHAGEWVVPIDTTTTTTTDVHTGQVRCLEDLGFGGYDCFGEEGYQAAATQEYCDGGYDLGDCCKPFTCAAGTTTTTTLTDNPCPGADGCNPCGDACFPINQDCFDAERGFGPDFSCETTEMWCGHDSGDGITVGMCCPDQCQKETEKKKKETKEEKRKKSEQERKDKRRKNEAERKAKSLERNKKRKVKEWNAKRDAKEKANKVAEEERKSKRNWDEAKRKKERGWKQRRRERTQKANGRERNRKKKERRWKNNLAERKNKNQNAQGSKETTRKEAGSKKEQKRKKARKARRGRKGPK